VAANQLAKAVEAAGWPGHDGFAIQVALKVQGKLVYVP